jgi:hypothetical protein
MLLSGQVYDNGTGKGIPYASISITENDGTTFLGGIAADEYGLFYLDSPALDNGKYLYVTSTGYMPVLIDDDVYLQSAQIGLDQAGTLPTVYVTPGSKSHNEWLLYLLFGGGFVLLLTTAKKEKRVSGVKVPTLSQNQWIDIALKIGIPVAIFFLIIKPILVALNLLPDKQEQQQNQSDQTAQNQQEKLGVYHSTDNHSHTAAEMDSVAVALRDSTQSWYGYDWNILAYQLTWIPGMTTADAQYFLGAFVKKNGYTLYRWYRNEFVDAIVLQHFDWDNVVWKPGWGGTGTPHDYSVYYNKLGITENNASKFSWPDVVKTFVTYVYHLAGVALQ